MLHPTLPTARPLAIAHRAGNDLNHIRQAERICADVIETDLWLYRNNLELRHLKTMGPIPLLWDRWKLAPAWPPRLHLAALLKASNPATTLMLDLKGRNPRLPDLLVETIHAHNPAPPIVFCSRTWPLLDALLHHPDLTLIYSVGSRDQLRAVGPKLDRQAHPAVSIHARLLTPAVMRDLKVRGATVITWPINTDDQLKRVLDLGADGITSDSLDLLARIVATRDKQEPLPQK